LVILTGGGTPASRQLPSNLSSRLGSLPDSLAGLLGSLSGTLPYLLGGFANAFTNLFHR